MMKEQRPPGFAPRHHVRLVLFAFFGLLVFLTGCRSADRVEVEVETEERAPLRLGVPMADDEAKLQAQYGPLLAHLSEGLGRKLELVTSHSYKSVGWLLEQSKIELAWFSGVAFLRVNRTHPAVPLARTIRFGRTTYLGWIVVKADSPIKTVRDLRGKRLAYVDPESGSGFVAPNQILLDAGLNPAADLAEASFTYGHLESLKGLADGRFDAAGVFEGAMSVYQDKLDPKLFRVLAESSPLPNDVVACSPQFDAGLQAKVKHLLLTMADSPQGKERLKAMYTYGALDGFTDVK